jgi:hypothetical protein
MVDPFPAIQRELFRIRRAILDLPDLNRIRGLYYDQSADHLLRGFPIPFFGGTRVYDPEKFGLPVGAKLATESNHKSAHV